MAASYPEAPRQGSAKARGSAEARSRGPTSLPQRGVALALSGGAARGMAHIGVLKALERAGTPPRLVAGTSYGAIIAALYALSGNALEVERVTRTQDVAEIWRQGLDFGLHRGALINGRRLTEWLDRKFFMGAPFMDTALPLAVACTDLKSRSLVTIRSGSVADAVRASCALPGIFAPGQQEGRTLIDGGFLEPIPFRALASAPAAVHLGVQAGVDVRRSKIVRTIRRFNVSRAGRALRRRADAATGDGALSQLLRGVSISLSSYSRGVRVPAGATLLRVDPAIAWWDFHRSPSAIAAGERAAELLLTEGGLLAAAMSPEPGVGSGA